MYSLSATLKHLHCRQCYRNTYTNMVVTSTGKSCAACYSDITRLDATVNPHIVKRNSGPDWMSIGILFPLCSEEIIEYLCMSATVKPR